MTKKEQKQIAEEQANRIRLRRHFLDSLQNYFDDLNAIERVNRINRVKNDPEMEKKNFERYPILAENGYMLKFPDSQNDLNYCEGFFWAMRKSEKEYLFGKNFERQLRDDELWVDDTIWSDVELCNYIIMMRKFGYNKMIYTNHSCSDSKHLTNLVEMGAKMVGANRYNEYSYGVGLVIDITNINLASWICFHKIPALEKDNKIANRNLIETFKKMYEMVK